MEEIDWRRLRKWKLEEKTVTAILGEGGEGLTGRKMEWTQERLRVSNRGF